MFIELVVESIGFIDEIIFEGLIEFSLDFISDWQPKRERQLK